jgi:GAF domain-containing protein
MAEQLPPHDAVSHTDRRGYARGAMPDPRRDEDPRLRRLADEHAALRRVATLVARGISPDQLFSAVSNEVGRLFGSGQAAIGRYEPEGSSVVYVGISQGLSMIPIGTRWPLEDFLASTTVYRTGRPARQEQRDYDTAAGQVAETLRELNTVSRVGAPIFVEAKLWGVLLVTDTHKRLPADTEERVAKFTELVGTAIANAESRAELASSEARARDLAQEQAALRRVATLVAEGTSADELFSAVTDEVGQLFGAQAAAARFEADGSGMIVVGLTSGIPVVSIGTRWPLEDFLASTTVYRTGRPARSDHTGHLDASGQVADSLREMTYVSTVAAPIMVEGSLWGVMTVSEQRKTLPPGTEERVAKFTELVATAIANAESRAELGASEARAHDLAGEQAALRRVATRVAERASADELFATVAQEVADVVGIPVIGLHRFEGDGTFTMVGIAGATSFTVGSRWPVEDEGLAGMILATGRPARKDDYTTMRGPLGAAMRDDRMIATVGVPIVVDGRIWGLMVGAARPGEPIPDGTEERLARFTELVATAIANGQARERLAQLVDEQAALRRIATMVAQESPPAEVFTEVAEAVAVLLGLESAAVFSYGQAGDATVVGSRGDPTGAFPVGRRFELDGDNLTARIHQTGLPARIDDYDGVSGSIGASVRQAALRSGVGSPILVDGRLWGALAAVTARPGPLPVDVESRLAQFSDLVATAISNVEARTEVQRLADEQAALRHVATLVAQDMPASELFGAVARVVGTLFGADFTAMIRYEADPTYVTTMAFWAAAGEHPAAPSRPRTVPGDPPSMLADTGKPTRVDDWMDVPGTIAEFVHGQLGVKSSVGCPIVVEGRLWGGLAVHSKGDPFPPATEARLLNFSELVATAIANTTARAEVSRLVDEQAALRRVATLVAQGASPDEVFSVVSNEVGRLFGSDQVAVGRYEPDGSGVIFAGVSQGMRGVTIGTRWPLEDFLALTTVYRTGRPATRERRDYEDISGPIAESLREMHFVSRIAAPIIAEGNLWGVMTVNDAHEHLAPDAEERVAKFTELVATAIANAESRAELTASRARVIAAADDARRRIERDLHDGAQQRLVTLSVALRTMETTMPAGSERSEVARIADGLAAAVQELRELSRGIHPAVLTQGGLGPALKALRRRSPVRVTLDIRFERRLPDQVEAAAYYTVSEALTNASRHASATRVWVDVQMTDGTLQLSIRDDGVGGADPSRGSGLTGLKDRIEALGGRIHIDSALGSGTHIEVEIPIRDEPDLR